MTEYLGYKFLTKFNIYGNDLGRYTIPYCALSMGLEVKFLNISNHKVFERFYKVEGNGGVFEISDGQRTFMFNYSRLWKDEQTNKIKKYSKDNLKLFLSELGIDTPKSLAFSINDDKDGVINQCQKFPLVVKPIVGSMGKGVYANLNTKEELIKAINAQKSNYLVESYIVGEEYRVYTIGGKVEAFCKREFSNVLGDGESSISQLIKKKNIIKNKMRIQSIRVNHELIDLLTTYNLSLDYIPKMNEKVILSYKKGRSTGGDIYQSLTGIPKEIIEKINKVAINIPEFFMLGIDCIISNGNVYILEINFRPQITSALMPDSGEGVDLPRKMIENLFEIKNSVKINPLNFKKILKSIEGKDIEWDYLSIKDDKVHLFLNTDNL